MLPSFLKRIPVLPSIECPYYEDKFQTVQAFYNVSGLESEVVDDLLNYGFRRSGGIYYRNLCEGCKLCVSYRLSVDTFRPNRSQRRNLKRNSDLTVRTRNPQPSSEKEELYLRYQLGRHDPESRDRESIVSVMYEQIYEGANNSVELEVYIADRLIGFSVLDCGRSSTSAVYSVFDPDYSDRSLGVFLILQMLEKTRSLGAKYLHLGFWIPNHSKMEYKSKFRPAEILDREDLIWKPLEKDSCQSEG